MKLFEYMAAKRPIIASDLPSIREIGSFGGVDKVIYFKADDPSDLAEKIVAIQGNSGGSVHIIEGAYEYVKHMSWNARAHNILDHIS